MEHITQEIFSQFMEQNTEPEWLTQYRKNAFAQIVQQPMMTFQCGLSIFIGPLNFEWSSVLPQRSQDTSITIKAQGARVLANTTDMNQEELAPFFTDEWKEDDDNNQVYYFNSAFVNNVLHITVPKNTNLTEPIKIHFDAKDPISVARFCIHCEAQSHCKIMMFKASEDTSTYCADDLRILAEPGSSCEVLVIQNMSESTLNIQKRKAIAKKDSTVNWTEVCLGTHYTRSEITSQLNGQGASTNNTVLFLGTGEQRYDIYTGAIHNAQNTYANLLTKGVLNNNAQSLARGLISIRKDAQDSNGYEQQDTLMLSDTAQANAKPDLEIHNHNVKCSHGSTIGKVDQDLQFYLMSRGLSEKEAQKKIAEGYFTPVLKEISDEEVKNRVQESIIAALDRQ